MLISAEPKHEKSDACTGIVDQLGGVDYDMQTKVNCTYCCAKFVPIELPTSATELQPDLLARMTGRLTMPYGSDIFLRALSSHYERLAARPPQHGNIMTSTNEHAVLASHEDA